MGVIGLRSSSTSSSSSSSAPPPPAINAPTPTFAVPRSE
ncbi:hypothetical protein TIFTF001_018710 [Ficus carica]|uniref:Uncharacterized protein n=1 Tax=Ficus carica TaxID=3494 RepID=A0AA88ACY9_FICCA|nr:hypothetical protein TIFTF001_018710 [Ficus carica]